MMSTLFVRVVSLLGPHTDKKAVIAYIRQYEVKSKVKQTYTNMTKYWRLKGVGSSSLHYCLSTGSVEGKLLCTNNIYIHG